jgi:hypothetical protein
MPKTIGDHAASGWRIHCGVEVTELSTNKQHTLSGVTGIVSAGGNTRAMLVNTIMTVIDLQLLGCHRICLSSV